MSRKSRSSSSSAPAGAGAAHEPLVCASCALRYGLDERFCASCGMPLTYAGREDSTPARDAAHEHARKIRPELAEGQLVRVAWASNQAEAELLQGLLLSEGIPSLVRRSGGFDVPDFLAGGPRDVLVPASGVSAARELLRAADFDPVEPPAPVPLRRHLVLGLAVGGGGFVTALITWLLLDAAG